MCSITEVGDKVSEILGQTGSKFCFPRQPKAPIDLQWENALTVITPLLLIGSSLNLQVTRTGIKSQISLIWGQVGLLALELLDLERENFSQTYNGKKML